MIIDEGGSSFNQQPRMQPVQLQKTVVLDASAIEGLSADQMRAMLLQASAGNPNANVVIPQQTTAVVAPQYEAHQSPIVTEDDIDKLGKSNADQMTKITSQMLGSVKASDVDVFGKQLTELIGQARKLDPTTKPRTFLQRIFNAGADTKQAIVARYQTVEQQMNILIGAMQNTVKQQETRIVDVQKLFEQTHQYRENMIADIKKGEQMLINLQQEVAFREQTETMDNHFEVAEARARLDRLDQQLDDFRRSVQLANTSMIQLKMMQEVARSLVQKFKTMHKTTIPLYMQTFTAYVIQQEQQQSIQLGHTIHDMTDEGLRKQAEMLRLNMKGAAELKVRSVVSMDTLRQVNEDLIGAATDAEQVVAQARAARAAAIPELQQMEQQLISAFRPKAIAAS